jgi:hopanoid biosynthesis associated protein HpnK
VGPGERDLKRLIVTGDDFGLSLPVNRAIEMAHGDGILTTACLMVAAPMAADAVDRAKRLPCLGVGLHVVVVRGRATLPPAAIPDLVDRDGRFDNNLVRAGLRYFFLPNVRRQLAAEIRAQFEAFRATGLRLDHANAHNHMQLHPTVLGLIIRIGAPHGLRAMRVPFEPLAGAGVRSMTRLGGWLLLAPWIAAMKRRMARAGIRYNDRVFGLADTGRMDRERVMTLLRCLPDGITEMFFHPATDDAWPEADPNAAGFRFRDELAALVDAGVRARVAATGARLARFSDLD